QIYVETAETTNNFYIDEAIGAVAGTTIIGAGEAKQVIRGDVDFSGTIDALDVSAIKHGYMKGFDSSAEKAADVDQSGVVDAEDIKLLKEYVLGKIDKFPVAEKVIDTAAMESLFATIQPSLSYKKLGENNVCWTQRFGADPGFMVYKDRLYVFTTNDAVEYRADGSIQPNTYNSGTINCFSTADLVNWTDHGPLPIAGKNSRTTNGVCAWASYAWAPDAAWKTINGKDKFFLYFADSAGGIGVVTADSPEGPYTDPLGHALINKGTNGYGDVEWLFDPAVLVDDDGTGYLYCGGGVPSGKAADPGTARAVKLGADMISLDGSPARINPPYLFEDSSILKVGNTYYYSYCTNWSTGGNPYGFGNAQIGVMTSTSPLGPFTYKGIAFKNPAEYSLDGGGNNHHSIVEFKGKYYMLYHSRNQSRAMDIKAYDSNGNLDLGGNYRSCHIDSCSLSNGMFSATGTMKGVEPVGTLNPYEKVRASTIYRQGGLNTRGVGDTIVTDIQKGDWFGVKNVEFSKGASKVTMKVSSSKGGAIKICTGSETGAAVGYIEVPATGGSFQEVSGTVSGLSGIKDIYFVFSDEMEVDSWSFE
ncbi:MAG: family 43 glycosylhydrolase, partial [Oscillospiraceae bacterium]